MSPGTFRIKSSSERIHNRVKTLQILRRQVKQVFFQNPDILLRQLCAVADDRSNLMPAEYCFPDDFAAGFPGGSRNFL